MSNDVLTTFQEAKPAEAPQGVDPSLLPQGYTDIREVQAAVGSNKGIGRRLAATCWSRNSFIQYNENTVIQLLGCGDQCSSCSERAIISIPEGLLQRLPLQDLRYSLLSPIGLFMFALFN